MMLCGLLVEPPLIIYYTLLLYLGVESHVTARCQGLFPPSQWQKGKSPGNEVDLIGYNEGYCSNNVYILLPCFYGIRFWIWPEPLVAPRVRWALGTRMSTFKKITFLFSSYVANDFVFVRFRFNKTLGLIKRICRDTNDCATRRLLYCNLVPRAFPFLSLGRREKFWLVNDKDIIMQIMQSWINLFKLWDKLTFSRKECLIITLSV
jgi:hypothetical protein